MALHRRSNPVECNFLQNFSDQTETMKYSFLLTPLLSMKTLPLLNVW